MWCAPRVYSWFVTIILFNNDLKNISNALDAIVSADYANLFISDKNINALFTKPNLELQKMNEWFKANKLSPNTKNQLFPYTIKIPKTITCSCLFQY